MAINSIITQMERDGLRATMELLGGKWCHTPEYFTYRYGGRLSKSRPAPAPSALTNHAPILILMHAARKLTPSERILLIAQLEAK